MHVGKMDELLLLEKYVLLTKASIVFMCYNQNDSLVLLCGRRTKNSRLLCYFLPMSCSIFLYLVGMILINLLQHSASQRPFSDKLPQDSL
jgi:hypothetical protein